MAKECVNCGCKIGFMSGERLKGLLCDQCYLKFGGSGIILLEGKDDPQEFIECHEKISNTIDKEASATRTNVEKIKETFFQEIDEKFKLTTGCYIQEAIRIKEEAIRINKEKNEKELERVNYAMSFNELYEYDVVTIINENHGTVDKGKMMEILSEHARNGWKLHTIYSNELGKNALMLLGFGVNATASEDVLIFERRIRELD